MLSSMLMYLKHGRFLFSLFCFIQMLVSAPLCAQEADSNLPFVFINSQVIHLRDTNLGNPQIIEAGSRISIDSKFLLAHLGSETPSQEQVQRLLLNPGEVSKDQIVTQRFVDAYNKKVVNDYFFPVSIITKSGKIKSGKMAVHAYNRTGMLELKRTDGTDVAQFQSKETTEKMKSLVEQNRASTEAQAGCADCGTKTPAQSKALADIARNIDGQNNSSNPLWAKYKDFAREFSASHKNISRSKSGLVKREFIKSLIEKFGEKDSGLMLAALTGFGEAPYRSSNATQIAEVAAVLKVIENRAESRFRSKSRTLRDIGVSETADARLTAILADWQFSAWNDRDNNLKRILSFNPDTSDEMTKRGLALSFEAQSMMQSGKVEFLGKMGDSKLQHYHANYVNPAWNKASNRVNTPTIKVDGIEIDLSKQKGARHVFYSGLS